MRHRRLLVGVLGVTLGALPAHHADGQVVTVWNARPALEGAYTQLRFTGGPRPARAEGLAGRLLWGAAPIPGAPSRLADRTSAGLYAAYTPEAGLGFSTTQLGLVADVRPFGPIGEHVEPFVSLGAGALHVGVLPGRGPDASRVTPLAARTSTAFALTPGLGTRLRLVPGLAVQASVSDLLTFRDGPRSTLALGAGVRMER